MPAPSNDDFADAQTISGTSGSTSPVVIVDATVEPGEPAGSGYVPPPGPFQTIWYKWVAPASGTATFNLNGSTTDDGGGPPFYDSYVLTIWTGSSLADLNEVGSLGFFDSVLSVDVAVTAGTTYWLQAGYQFDSLDPATLIVNWSMLATGRLRLAGPPLWRLIVTDLAGKTLTILDKRSKDRSFTFTLNQAAVHSGLVPSDDPEINIPSPSANSPAFVSHNTRLIYGLRRERRTGTSSDPWVCRFGGILMTTEDVAADAPTTRYTAYDPWQYLMARPARNPDGTLPTASGVTYRDARASDIAVELLANTVAIDGDVFIDASDSSLIEDTNVIDGLTKFDQGVSVGEAWQQLCDTGTIDIVLRPIYDPMNRPGKLCELVIKKRAGSVRHGAVFGWDRAGRNTTELSRLLDGTRLANRLKLFTGSGRSVPPQSDLTSIATYGEYWSQQFALGKQSQTALALLLALSQLEMRKNGELTVTFTPAPELSPVTFVEYELGDYVALWSSRALREPIGVDYDSFDADAPGASGYQRVFAIPITLDDNGAERVDGILTTLEADSASASPPAEFAVVIAGGTVVGDTLTAIVTP